MVSRTLAFAWKAIFISDLVVLLYGLMLSLNPNVLESGFTTYTGQSFSALISSSPKTAEYILLTIRLLGSFNAAFAVVAVGIALTGFRKGEPWSWFTLLAGNAIGYGSSIAVDLTVGAIGVFEELEFAFAALIFVELSISAIDIFRKKNLSTR